MMIRQYLKTFLQCNSCHIRTASAIPSQFIPGSCIMLRRLAVDKGRIKTYSTFNTTGTHLPKTSFQYMSKFQIRHRSEDSSKYEDKVNLSFKARLFIVSGIAGLLGGFFLFLQREKELEKQKKRSEALKSIGGKFELVDHDGNIRTQDDFLGQWLFLYFGFTHCPDICPDTIDKMVSVVDTLDKDNSIPAVQPLFISVDPDRDTVKVIKEYVREFSPRIIGLTGPKDKILDACRSYRVYVGVGPKDEFGDYIVDHTVIIYLINPNGEFVDYFGLTHDAEKIVQSVKFNIRKYEELQKKLKSWWSF